MHISIPLATLLLSSASLVSAVCRNVTQVRTVSDGPTGFSTSGTVSLEKVYCGNSTGCTIPRKSYPNVTFGRSLNITTSAESAEDIYAAAQMVWQEVYDRPRSRNGTNYTVPAFINRTMTVHTDSTCPRTGIYSNCLGTSTQLLDVKSDYTTTLYYTAFQYYTFMRLENCTNSTLNGVSVHVVVPQWNETSKIVPGTFGASAQQGDTNAAGRLKIDGNWSLGVAMVGLLAFMIV